MNFIDWLKSNNACNTALEWVCEQPDKSLPALLQTCPHGDWILWVYERAGYDFNVLAPVVYAAVNRAFVYAADALDKSGVKHDLRKHIITDRTTARAARSAAYTAYAARAAVDAAYAAGVAAAAAVYADYAACAADYAARAAAYAAGAAYAGADADTEHKKCADDCREFLPPIVIPTVEATQDE